ncbi:transposase [Micromonospora sp. U56]|uniref:transposase n=1 Tax=Micromonospora sp. U56 TaxID=2824900 RepID=UPI001FFD8465|nr:transposase [Micromonospora sp. U56]
MFALGPSDVQVAGLRRNTGAARFVYNHMLRRVSAVKAQRAAEASYGVAEADLTPWQGWSLPDLRRTWNEIKTWVAPWWAHCSKEAFNTGLANLSAALGNWHASRTGARKGRRMGWPRTRLAQQFTTVVVEDLHVAGMVRNPRLARALIDAAPATLRRHLGYKTGWYGSVLYVADRWYPSSKTCSGCQTVKPKLSLAERTFNCATCGLSLDRDINAARNLAGLVRHVDLELPGDAKTGRGAYVRPVRPAPAGRAAGREASRPVHPVNAARQRTAANRESRLLTER